MLGHHFETDLEIIQEHLDKGDSVTFLGCNGALKQLKFMSCYGLLRCQYCISRKKSGLSEYIKNPRFKILSLKNFKSKGTDKEVSTDLFKIKSLIYKNVDIGSAYLSSLISEYRDPEPNLTKLKSRTTRTLGGLRDLTDQFEKVLDLEKPDTVYLFNGRFSIFRPLVRLCEMKKVPYFVHERGPNNSMYTLSKDSLPHDISAKLSEMNQGWESSTHTQEQKIKIAQQWFVDRARGHIASWVSFTENQKSESLPTNWDEKKRNITIFVSSEDEFASIPGWELDIFESQYEGIKFICETMAQDSNTHVYIRMHPNMIGLKSLYIRNILALSRLESCTIIASDSKISSYALLNKSEKIVTFGSTIGIEATYWQVPSILVGKSFYQDLDCVEIPQTQQELTNLLRSSFKSKPRESTYKYGYWSAMYGITFKHYKSVTLTKGLFKDRAIESNLLFSMISYLTVFLFDLYKIANGEYSWWHLKAKIINKIKFVKKAE